MQTVELKPLLIDAREVAQLMGVSLSHVRRLADRGALPSPRKVGRLIRWSRREIEEWIAGGCPSTRRGGAR